MSAIGNMKTNIPPKARIMLILTVLVVVGIVWFTYSRLSSSPLIQGQGAAELSPPPTTQQISRDRPTDVVRFDEDTAVGQIYQQDQIRRSEEAEANKKTHVDDIRIRTEAEKNTPVAEAPRAKEPEPRAQSRLEILLEERRQKQQEEEQKVVVQRAAAATGPAAENPWRLFVGEEKSKSNGYAQALSQQIGQARIASRQPISASVSAGRTGNQNNAGDANTLPPQQAGWERYLNDQPQSTNQGPLMVQQQASPANRGPNEAIYVDSSPTSTLDYPSERLARDSTTKALPSGKINVGEIYMGVLQIGVNTDEISPVRVTIVEQGSLANAVLTGMPERRGKSVMIEMQNMSIGKDSYGISAVLLDPDTRRSVMADGVNHHTIERYSKLFVASFVEGFSSALSGSQTVTDADGRTTKTTDAMPETKDQVKAGIGKIGEKVGPIYEAQFMRPPTVTVNDNRPVLVMFMRTVDLEKQNQ